MPTRSTAAMQVITISALTEHFLRHKIIIYTIILLLLYRVNGPSQKSVNLHHTSSRRAATPFIPSTCDDPPAPARPSFFIQSFVWRFDGGGKNEYNKQTNPRILTGFYRTLISNPFLIHRRRRRCCCC